MQISKINNFNTYRNNNIALSKNNIANFVPNNSRMLFPHNVSAENIKANFMPAFGKEKKVGEVLLTDRETKKNVVASLKREKITKNYHRYKLYVDKKEAGFMDLNMDSSLQGYGEVPEIHYLRSIKGDEYSGIGSALVKTAIIESEKKGYKGALWLIAEKGFEKKLSPYRSNENPIPFYYKLGFRAFEDEDDIIIKHHIKKGDIEKLPDEQILILTPANAHAKNDYLNCSISFKEKY